MTDSTNNSSGDSGNGAGLVIGIVLLFIIPPLGVALVLASLWPVVGRK